MEKYILIYIYNYYICLKIDFFHIVLLFGFQMTCHNEPCFELLLLDVVLNMSHHVNLWFLNVKRHI